jgi:hypothetical protein
MIDVSDYIPLGDWTRYSSDLRPERESKMLAGRLLVFHNGVSVKRCPEGYHIYVWSKNKEKEILV